MRIRKILALMAMVAPLAACFVPPPQQPAQRVQQQSLAGVPEGFSWRGFGRQPADQCLPPRQLVVTNNCRETAKGLECKNTCAVVGSQ